MFYTVIWAYDFSYAFSKRFTTYVMIIIILAKPYGNATLTK